MDKNKNIFSCLVLIAILIFPYKIFAQHHETSDLTIYLVRHAETKSDNENPGNPSLSEKGRDRAQNLLTVLNEEMINELYSTDLFRTKETIKPVADYYNIEIAYYSPSSVDALREFANDLKTKSGSIVVAGHSNTTPVLAYLLSGEYAYGIDESEYDNIFIIKFKDGVSTMSVIKYPPLIKERKYVSSFKLDSSTLPEEAITYTYEMRNGDDLAGLVTWEYEVEDKKTLSLTMNDNLEQYNVNTENTSLFSVEESIQLSTKIQGSYFGGEQDINVKWDEGKIIGTSTMNRNQFSPQGTLKFDEDLNRNLISRSTALGLSPFTNTDEAPFTIEWFDTYQGEKRLIEVTTEEYGEITVPAGTFDTFKVMMTGGNPSQVLYITKETPRKVVKIEIPGQPWTYQLKSID